jgi:hypothetical protein
MGAFSLSFVYLPRFHYHQQVDELLLTTESFLQSVKTVFEEKERVAEQPCSSWPEDLLQHREEVVEVVEGEFYRRCDDRCELE